MLAAHMGEEWLQNSRQARHLAGYDHEGLAHTGCEVAPVGMDGEEDAAFLDELDGCLAGADVKFAAVVAQFGDERFERFDGVGFLPADEGYILDAGQSAAALDDFIGVHFVIHAENGAEFDLAGR